MAEKFTLPGFDDVPFDNPEGTTELEDEEAAGAGKPAFTLPGFNEPVEESWGEYATRLQGEGDPSNFQNTESFGELPQNLVDRTAGAFRAGAGTAIEGALETAKPTPRLSELTVGNVLEKLAAPLKVLGGPLEMFASPLTAVLGEGARAAHEALAPKGRFTAQDKSPLQHVEEWAPLLSTIGVGATQPGRRALKLAGRLVAAPGTKVPAEAAKRAAEGIRSTEGALSAMDTPEATKVSQLVSGAAAERDRLANIAVSKRARLVAAKGTPEYEDLIKAADPQRVAIPPKGFSVFSRAKGTDLWQEGMSRTATEYVHVPNHMAETLKPVKTTIGPQTKEELFTSYGRTIRGQAQKELRESAKLTPATDMPAGLELNEELIKAKIKQSVDEAMARGSKPKKSLFDLSGLTQEPGIALRKTFKPGETPGLPIKRIEWFKGGRLTPSGSELTQDWRQLYHSKRGLRPRAMKQYESPVVTSEGRLAQFTKVPRGTYFEHAFTPESSEKIVKQIAQSQFDKGIPRKLQGDITTFDEIVSLARGAHPRGSNAAIAEVKNYIKDPLASFDAGMENWARAVGRHASLGGRGEKLFGPEGAVTQLGKKTNAEVAEKITFAIKRDLEFVAPRNIYSDALTTYQALTKMSLSFVSNLTQGSYNFIINGFRDTTKGLLQTLYQGGRGGGLNAITNEIGVVRKAAIRDLERELGGMMEGKLFGKVTKTALKPFEWSEGPINRNWASATGLNTMKRLDEKLATTGKLAPSQWRWLERSGLDVNAVQRRVANATGPDLAKGLTKEEIARGVWGSVDRAQLLPRATAMPFITRSTPVARVLTQFKTFAIRASRTLVDEVFKEAFTHGNFAPLARMLVVMPPVGELARRGMAKARGREMEEFPDTWQGWVARGLYNMLYVGGLGIMTDVGMSVSRGVRGGLSIVGGPSGTEGFIEGQNIYKTFKHGAFGGPKDRRKLETTKQKMLRGRVQGIPFVGPHWAENMKTFRERRQTKPY